MVDVWSVGKHAGGLAWVAARSFVGTVLVLTLAGIALAGVSFYYLSESPWWAALVAVIAMVEAVAAGVVLGFKRAVILTLAHGLRTLRLGRPMIQLVFKRLLGVSAEEQFGERGGKIAQTVERLPLAQAEQKLTRTVNDLIQAPPEGSGWFRHKLQAQLMRLVQKSTLARFRAEGAQSGGVDLVKVQTDLEERIDDLLIAKLRGGLNLWTIGVIIGLPLIVAVEAALVYFFLISKG